MKKLIVVRHGSYDGRSDDPKTGLSARGRRQMASLQAVLGFHIETGSNVRILCSSFLRCRESADILAETLGVEPIESDLLISGGSFWEDIDAVIGLINHHGDGVDMVVVVTHYEYACDLPQAFARKVIDVPRLSGLPHEVGKGEAVVIDCETREATHCASRL